MYEGSDEMKELKKILESNPEFSQVFGNIVSKMMRKEMSEALRENPDDISAQSTLIALELNELVRDLNVIMIGLMIMPEEEMPKHLQNIKLAIETLKVEIQELRKYKDEYERGMK